MIANTGAHQSLWCLFRSVNHWPVVRKIELTCSGVTHGRLPHLRLPSKCSVMAVFQMAVWKYMLEYVNHSIWCVSLGAAGCWGWSCRLLCIGSFTAGGRAVWAWRFSDRCHFKLCLVVKFYPFDFQIAHLFLKCRNICRIFELTAPACLFLQSWSEAVFNHLWLIQTISSSVAGASVKQISGS